MTIGIAAFGARAGLAVVEGLRAAEAVGHGALHGFVSLVVVGADGRLHRAEIQNGGTAGLLAGGPLPPRLAEATCAGLMSSGPNRPTPLCQFTPADPAVGLVTGHRFPNMPGADGVPLNRAVMELMRGGLSPKDALAAAVQGNPAADAGFIALSLDGRIAVSNTPYVNRFGDAGSAVSQTGQGSNVVAVLHNAIAPSRSLAPLVVEVALSILRAPHQKTREITAAAGVRLVLGPDNAIEIDDSGAALNLWVRDARYLAGDWSLGLGYRAIVCRRGAPIGRALYEPYLRARNGVVVEIDGGASVQIPIVLHEEQHGTA